MSSPRKPLPSCPAGLALVLRFGWLVCLWLGVLWGTASGAWAQDLGPVEAPPEPEGALSGNWIAEPMKVRWVIGQWGEACGPKPSGGGDSGGPVRIVERGGELSIGGTFSTRQCWAMHPELTRSSHSAGDRRWSSTCRTAPNDPRQEVLTTTVIATDDVIRFQESGQYQFSVAGETCSASSGRWRTYRRAGEKKAPPSRPTSPCARPGPPARMEVRPALKLMRPGESFQFEATVQDARGCAVRSQIRWLLEPSDVAQLEGGKLSIPADAGDAELMVTVSVSNRSVSAAVRVVSHEMYQKLLDSGDFDADGASREAAAAAITQSVGSQELLEDPDGDRRKWLFVSLVGGIALLLLLVGLAVFLKSRRSVPAQRGNTVAIRNETVLLPEEQEPEPEVGGPCFVCPVCGTLYDEEIMDSCPRDGARVMPLNR